MAKEDNDKNHFHHVMSKYCYRVMPFELKNIGATYQWETITLFHDMMHKEIEVYIDDMITKCKQKEDHV
jgi:hypothetical protein